VSAKTHSSALVLIPPVELWPPIQLIRTRHDRNARRWMPHVTLLYPFRPRAAFAAVTPPLAEVCRNIAPFAVTLARFDRFIHGRRGATLYLAPEPAEPLIALQTALWRTLPDLDDTRRHAKGFTPHLSVGQAPGSEEATRLLAELSAGWTPLHWTVDRVALIWRAEPPDDAFRVAEQLPLGGEGVRTGAARTPGCGRG
jgi:RNA 2',3'-cyclic 3'-phosphodiesterase